MGHCRHDVAHRQVAGGGDEMSSRYRGALQICSVIVTDSRQVMVQQFESCSRC